MTEAACQPLRTVGTIAEREQRPDRFAELLVCLADLMVETRRQHSEMAPHQDSDDERVQEAIARLIELEHSLGEVGLEAASVHQLLQHLQLICVANRGKSRGRSRDQSRQSRNPA